MKRLALLGGIFCAFASLSPAEVDSEIPLGIEAVTGIRTDYVHRGFELAGTSLDFQLEAEITLSDETSFHSGLSHLSESDGDFSETSGYFGLSHSWSKKLTLEAFLTYRDRSSSLLNSGLDLGFSTSYRINDDWAWRNELNFDFGEDALYLASELEWSKVLSDQSFITLEAGLSYVSNYLDRDGLNDLYSRLSYTFALSDQVSFTPFVGTSIQLEDKDASDVAFGGIWFEVIF